MWMPANTPPPGARLHRLQDTKLKVSAEPTSPTPSSVRSAGRPPPHFTVLPSKAGSCSIFYSSEPSEPFHPTFLCKPSSSPRRSWDWAGLHCELSRVPIVRKSGPAVSSLTAPGSWPPPLPQQLEKKGKRESPPPAQGSPSPMCRRTCTHAHK